MFGKQAKVLLPKHFKKLLAVAGQGRFPERDRLIVLLATRAGLRACEIARLTWGMVLDANGEVAATIDIRGAIAKRGTGRRVPLHPELRHALAKWLARQPRGRVGPDTVVLPSVRGGHGLSVAEALAREWRRAAGVLQVEGIAGAARFAGGKGRSGDFGDL